MDVSEYVEQDAVGLADLIRHGEVSAAEVGAAAAAAIDAVEPALNALVLDRFAEPLAYDASGPLAGVPFAIKDLVAHAAGVPQKAGSRLLGAGVPYPYDTDLVARFRGAGLAIVGVTATPEFGFNAATEPVATGPVANPWDVTRSPGGSSGGSAALVAARALPAAHANDGGGSIRIPAALCGLVGLKPSRGRTTVGPDYSDPLMGLGIEFAVTRTVRDCAALLDAVHGSSAGDRYLLPEPDVSFSTYAATGTAGRRLRVAVTADRADGGVVDAACRSAVEATARLLEEAGHVVEPGAPEVSLDEFDDANFKVWCSFLADGVHGAAAALGVVPGPQTLEATTLACAEYGASLTALDLYAVERTMNATTRSVARFFADVDVLVTPTTAFPNWPTGHLNADDDTLGARGWYDKIFDRAPFTALYNATGQPAISLPLGTSAEVWPVGVQLVARYGDEGLLLALAADLERAAPWIARRPQVCAG